MEVAVHYRLAGGHRRGVHQFGGEARAQLRDRLQGRCGDALEVCHGAPHGQDPQGAGPKGSRKQLAAAHQGSGNRSGHAPQERERAERQRAVDGGNAPGHVRGLRWEAGLEQLLGGDVVRRAAAGAAGCGRRALGHASAGSSDEYRKLPQQRGAGRPAEVLRSAFRRSRRNPTGHRRVKETMRAGSIPHSFRGRTWWVRR